MPPMKVKHYCSIAWAALLIILALVGPVLAFAVLSCTSTRTCNVWSTLSRQGAHCKEGDSQSQELMHEETCTVVCPEGYMPNVPQLVCDDGTAQGASELACEEIMEVGIDGGLVSGAVTGGLLRDVCPSAANLECTASVGSTAIFVQYAGVDQVTCANLLEECRTYNDAFDWGEYASGVCTMGCFAEVVLQAALAAAAASIDFGDQVVDTFSGVVSEADVPLCSSGPVCFTIEGNCNSAADGDYFRYPICASGSSQWAKLDETYRIRYDDRAIESMGGRWMIEQPSAGLSVDAYSQSLARQPSFISTPVIGTHQWDSWCEGNANSFQQLATRNMVEMTVRACTCTSDLDCNGNGVAVGSKEFGPNCKCYCDRGWDGDYCERRICRAPAVLNADQPSCLEGLNIQPGGTCTPACKVNYYPSVGQLTCTEYGNFSSNVFGIVAYTFSCGDADVTSNLNTAIILGIDVSNLSSEPICGSSDCNNNGVATGWGSPLDDSCECECFDGFSGQTCDSYEGACPAPVQTQITDSHEFPCLEGRTISTTCTAQCLPEYYPLPKSLTCTPTGLYPSKFGCFGGPSVVETVCQAQRYTLLVGSAFSLMLLCMVAFMRQTDGSRSAARFMIKGHNIEMGKDDEGVFNIIRKEAKDMEPSKAVHVDNAAWMETLPDGKDFGIDDLVQAPAPQDDPEAARLRRTAMSDQDQWALATTPAARLQLTSGVKAQAKVRTGTPRGLRSSATIADLRGTSPISSPIGAQRNYALEDGETTLERGSRLLNSAGSLDEGQLALTQGSVPSSFGVSRLGRLASLSPKRNAASLGEEGGPLWKGAWQTESLRRDCVDMSLATSPGANAKTWHAGSSGGAAGEHPFGVLDRAETPAEPAPQVLPERRSRRPAPLALEDVSPDPGELALALSKTAGARSLGKTTAVASSPVGRRDGGDGLRGVESWQRELWTLQAKTQADRKARTFHVSQLEGRGAEGAVAEALAATQSERATAQAAMQSAMQAGDTEALLAATVRVRAVLGQLAGAPSTATGPLVAMLQVAEARLEQAEFDKQRLRGNQEYDDRVHRGETADWKMTIEELRAHVEGCQPQGVRAGLKALLPVSSRSEDGQSLTLLHYACRGALAEEGQEARLRRQEVVAMLLEARAQPNAEDAAQRTPLDLAIVEGGDAAESAPAVAVLRALGMRTSEEARREARTAAKTPTSSSSPKPGGQSTRSRMASSDGFRDRAAGSDGFRGAGMGSSDGFRAQPPRAPTSPTRHAAASGGSTPPRPNEVQPQRGLVMGEAANRVAWGASTDSPGFGAFKNRAANGRAAVEEQLRQGGTSRRILVAT